MAEASSSPDKQVDHFEKGAEFSHGDVARLCGVFIRGTRVRETRGVSRFDKMFGKMFNTSRPVSDRVEVA